MTNDLRLVRYRTDEGCKMALVTRRRKYLHCVMMTGAGLVVKKVPLSEERHMTDSTYNLHKAAVAMRRFGRNNGATKAAKTLLKGV